MALPVFVGVAAWFALLAAGFRFARRSGRGVLERLRERTAGASRARTVVTGLVMGVLGVPLLFGPRILQLHDDGSELASVMGVTLLSLPVMVLLTAFTAGLFLVVGWACRAEGGAGAVIAWAALCAAPLNAPALAGVLDVALDTSPGRVRDTVYLRTERPAKGQPYVVLRDWDGAGEVELHALRLPAGTAPGAAVRVRVHPGSLGVEWVETAVAAGPARTRHTP